MLPLNTLKSKKNLGKDDKEDDKEEEGAGEAAYYGPNGHKDHDNDDHDHDDQDHGPDDHDGHDPHDDPPLQKRPMSIPMSLRRDVTGDFSFSRQLPRFSGIVAP